MPWCLLLGEKLERGHLAGLVVMRFGDSCEMSDPRTPDVIGIQLARTGPV
jgi:hypothetical protein